MKEVDVLERQPIEHSGEGAEEQVPGPSQNCKHVLEIYAQLEYKLD